MSQPRGDTGPPSIPLAPRAVRIPRLPQDPHLGTLLRGEPSPGPRGEDTHTDPVAALLAAYESLPHGDRDRALASLHRSTHSTGVLRGGLSLREGPTLGRPRGGPSPRTHQGADGSPLSLEDEGEGGGSARVSRSPQDTTSAAPTTSTASSTVPLSSPPSLTSEQWCELLEVPQAMNYSGLGLRLRSLKRNGERVNFVSLRENNARALLGFFDIKHRHLRVAGANDWQITALEQLSAVLRAVLGGHVPQVVSDANEHVLREFLQSAVVPFATWPAATGIVSQLHDFYIAHAFKLIGDLQRRIGRPGGGGSNGPSNGEPNAAVRIMLVSHASFLPLHIRRIGTPLVPDGR